MELDKEYIQKFWTRDSRMIKSDCALSWHDVASYGRSHINFLINEIRSLQTENIRLLEIVEKYRPKCCEYETIVENHCISCGVRVEYSDVDEFI